MNNTPDGTPLESQLTPPAPANPGELSQAPAAPAASPNGTVAVEPNAELAALQAQLAAESDARQKAEQRARDTQAAYTQTRQQLAAVTGVQPQADPRVELAKQYVAKGYHEDVASALADIKLESQSELNQLRQQLDARTQAPMLAQQVLTAAYQAESTAFTDPSVSNAVLQNLSNDAARGIRIDPELAKWYAYQEIGRRTVEQRANPGGTQTVARPAMPQFASMNGPLGGFQPAAAAAPVVNPQVDEMAAKMAAHLRLPKQA